MKRRVLPFSYFILAIGIAAIFISANYSGDTFSAKNNETATAYLNKLRVNQTTGQINPADFYRAWQQVEKSDALRGGGRVEYDWLMLGPDNAGGRTRAILYDNQDPTSSTVYAGSVMGGMFKSVNEGVRWEKINVAGGNLNVTCIAQASNGDIYVGTGEGFTVEEYTAMGDWGYDGGFLGKGIFKSTDGDNFTQVDNTSIWPFINELAVEPNTDMVFASTNAGLNYSADGGATWQVATTSDGEELSSNSMDVKIGPDGLVITEVNNLCYISDNGDPSKFMVHSSDSSYDLPNQNVGRIEFATAPSDASILYAIVVTPDGALYNVYSSSDRGMTWNVIGPGGSVNFNIFNTGSNVSDGVGLYSCTIEVFPEDAGHIILGGMDMWEGIKVQEEGFFDWRQRSFTPDYWISSTFLFSGHHVYKFKPGSANICMIGTNGGISQGTLNEEGFYFESRNKNYIASQFYTINTSNDERIVIGGAQDLGSIYIDGKTNPADGKRGKDIWSIIFDIPNGANGGYSAISSIYPTAFIYSRTPHPAKNGNIETFVRRNEFGGFDNWSTTMFTDRYASTTFLSPFLLWESYEDYSSRDSIGVNIFVNVPAGNSIWVESMNGKRPFKYTTPVDLHPGDSIVVQDIVSSKFFIGGDDRVLMTKEILQFDKAPEWFVIANKDKSGFEGHPSCMAYSREANHLFVGTLEGKLYRISNITYAYDFQRADVTSPYCVISTTRIPVYLPGTSTEISQTITSVSVNPNNQEQVIITLGNYGNEHYVYLTNNALGSEPVFTSVQGNPNNGGLPQMPVYSSLFEMDPDNNLVFVGTEYGIYVSDNVQSGTPTWTMANNHMGKVPVLMLKQQLIRKENDTIFLDETGNDYMVYEGTNNYGVIYGATYGRGLIATDQFQKPVGINDPRPPAHSEACFEIYPNPATNLLTVAFSLDDGQSANIAIFNLNGRLVQSYELGTLPKGKQEYQVNCSGLSSGIYVMRLTMGSKISSSKFVVQ